MNPMAASWGGPRPCHAPTRWVRLRKDRSLALPAGLAASVEGRWKVVKFISVSSTLD